MILNNILGFLQDCFSNIYEKSVVLKNIDLLILISIICLILSAGFMPSDSIANFAIITVVLTAMKLLTKRDEKFSLSLADKFLLIYFLAVLVSVAGSSYLCYSLKGFSKTLLYIGYYISCLHYLKSNKTNVIYILSAFFLVGIFESFVAFHQNFMSVAEISSWQDVSSINPEDVMTRVYGAIKPYNPNLFGGYMLAILPVSLFFTVFAFKNHYVKTFYIILLFFLMNFITVFLTGCRGAYIALFMQAVVLFCITYKLMNNYYKKIYLWLIGAFALISSFIVVMISSLRKRIFSIFAMRNDSSNSFRFNVYQSCIDMFKDNWLLGIGVGNQNFREIYGLYMKTGYDALSAYNIYLETAVESGIFALIAFLAFIFANVVKAVKYVLSSDAKNRLYVITALISIVGMLVHGFVDTVFFRPQIQFVFWTMIAIIQVYSINTEGITND